MANTEGLRSTLEAFSLDEPGAVDPFSARLTRENCWTVEQAQRVIREYKRFMLLALVAGHPVSPSDSVDQVWHLHLAYTRSYWEKFCEGVLGRPLHHEPSRGGGGEHVRFRDDYEKTLEAYRRTFAEEPPSDIWPAVDRRFGEDQCFVRVSPKRTLIVAKQTLRNGLGIAVVGAGALALALPPVLQLAGPTFLWLYAALWLACLTLAFWAKHETRANAPANAPELQPYDAAYLAGNEPAVADAAIANLVATGSFALDADGATIVVNGPLSEDAHPVEGAAYDRARSETPAALHDAYAAAAAAARDIRMRLRGLGLIVDRTSALPLLLALAAPALGVAKVVSGLIHDKPVGWLLVLIVIGVVVALYYYRPRPGLSAHGQVLLDGLKQAHANLQTPSTSDGALAGGMVPLAVGLFGLAVLPALGLGGLSSALGRTQERATKANGGGGGGGWCGGGGCGGGGCGGGCGGCGGGE